MILNTKRRDKMTTPFNKFSPLKGGIESCDRVRTAFAEQLRHAFVRTRMGTLFSYLKSLTSLNRLLFNGVTMAGFAALAMAVRKPWFVVPVAPIGGATTADDIVGSIPGCTVWFQMFVAIGAILIAASWLRKFEWRTSGTVLSSFIGLITLSYPYFVMVRSPEVSADAAWLQAQHDNLTWLGGDIYANAEFANMGWKSKSYLIDTPRQLSVINLPSWSPWEIGLHRCEDLMLWLGYSNSFCQFVGKGWAMAIIGSVFLFLASLQHRGRLVFNRAGVALVLFTLAGTIAAVVGWSLPFQASREIRSAAELCSQRRFAESQLHLNKAVSLLPVLGQDTYYVAQRGLLDAEQGIESDYATLRNAVALEADARYDQAFALIEPLTRSHEAAVRREALRGIMRFAIQDYNCARFELSSQRFHTVLREQPCNVKLIYLIQLQGIRESRVDSVDAMRDWMYEVCTKMNFGTTKILRAVVQQHSAIAAGLDGDADAIWAAQEKAKRP